MLSRDKTDGKNSQVVGLLDIGTSKVAWPGARVAERLDGGRAIER